MVRKKDIMMIGILFICGVLMFFYPAVREEANLTYDSRKLFYYIMLIVPLLYISASYITMLLIRQFIIISLDYRPFIFNLIGIGVGGLWLFFTLIAVVGHYFELSAPVLGTFTMYLSYLTPFKFIFIVIGSSLNLCKLGVRKTTYRKNIGRSIR